MTIKIFYSPAIETVQNISVAKTHGDNAAVVLFADSLANSIRKQFYAWTSVLWKKRENVQANREGKDVPYPEVDSPETQGIGSKFVSFLASKPNANKFHWGDKKTCVRVDVYSSSKGGKFNDFCKVSIEQSNGDECGVREQNMLPEFARLIYADALLLKRLPPPRGMERLSKINLIKNFTHPNDATEKCEVLLDDNGNPKEVVVVPR